ncbi:uncharacterized protein PAC_03658 [Phialocephala subalpina]|uniref:DUF6594 domain-containing protein n=1 Tax=Phialocephala subalpina TaxID=576137 RepID=A0A1L7WLY8_9HELO|nr:uncharacterized protein PAC_03658 [Phialocephala subalpina]
MKKALDFLDDYDSKENLFIVYYAGHGYINQDRQSTWACSTDANSPTVDWSHIQGLFERAKSDVLVLLDCCAAASSAPRRTNSLMETIAACGFEGRAPPPGEHSFTTSLIEVLEDWINAPSFSVTMLHSEVLRVLMRRRKEKCRNGQKLEWRSTPVHINNYTHPRAIGIELSKRSLIDTEKLHPNRSLHPIADLLGTSTHGMSATYLDLMSLSCDSLDESLRASDEAGEPGLLFSSSSTSKENVSTEVTPNLKLPHMLVSIALDEDQSLPNAEACRRWICAFPGLAKYVKVEGIFSSYSTVLILSIPVAIWNILPENPACQPITYVTSRNLAREPSEQNSDFKIQLSTSPTTSSTTHTLGHSAEFPSPERHQRWDSKLDVLDGLRGTENASSFCVDTSSNATSSTMLSAGISRQSPSEDSLYSWEHGRISHTPINEAILPSQHFETLPAKPSAGSSAAKVSTENLMEEGLAEGSRYETHPPPSSFSLPGFRRSRQTTTRFNNSSEDPRTSFHSQIGSESSRHGVRKSLHGGDLEEHPQSWPRLAASMNSADSSGVYRRFEQVHNRLLVQHMSSITLLESKLHDLDRSDTVVATESSKLRHRTTKKDGSNNVQKRHLLEELEKKLIAYDTLLLQYQKMRDLECTPEREHQSLFNWILDQKALDENGYQLISHPEDFFSLSSAFSLEYRCRQLLQRLYQAVSPHSNRVVGIYLLTRAARLIVVLLATGVLIAPVIMLFFWAPGRDVSLFVIFSAILAFCTFMSLFTGVKVEEVLIGTATKYGSTYAREGRGIGCLISLLFWCCSAVASPESQSSQQGIHQMHATHLPAYLSPHVQSLCSPSRTQRLGTQRVELVRYISGENGGMKDLSVIHID